MKKILPLLTSLLLGLSSISAQVSIPVESISQRNEKARNEIHLTPTQTRETLRLSRQATNQPSTSGSVFGPEGTIYIEHFEDNDSWSVHDEADKLQYGGGRVIDGVKPVDGSAYLFSGWDKDKPRDARATSPEQELEGGSELFVSVWVFAPHYRGRLNEFQFIARNKETGAETILLDYSGDKAKEFAQFTKLQTKFTPAQTGFYEFEFWHCTKVAYTNAVAVDRFFIGTEEDTYVREEPETLIPDGDWYPRMLTCTHSSFGLIDIQASYCEGKDGVVYLRGLSPQFPGAWVYGHKKGDIVEIPTHQYLGTAYEIDMYFEAGKDLTEEDGHFLYTRTDSYHLRLDGDTLRAENGNEFFIEDGGLSGAAGYSQSYNIRPYDFTATKPKDAEKAEQYQLTYLMGNAKLTAKLTNVVFEGDDMYVQGLSIDLPQAWIKGRREGNKVTFKSGQYLGTQDRFYPAIFHGAIFGSGETTIALGDEMTMDVDGDKFTANNPFIITLDGGNLTYFGADMQLKPFVLKPATPMPPLNLEYITVTGTPYIQFAFENVDTEGDLLLEDSLYYRLYIDGERYTFDTSYYYELDGPKTEISVTYRDWHFIHVGTSYRVISFIPDGEWWRMAIELAYRVNGVENLSDWAVFDNPEKIGIERTEAGNKTVKEVFFTNLLGQTVDEHTKGIVLKTFLYDDGTRETVKVINK